MPLAEDTAEELIALYEALGAVNVLDAVGSVSSGGVTVPDPTTAAYTSATLAQTSTAFLLPTPRQGARFALELTQDGTGGRLATFSSPSGTVKFVGGTPTLSVGAAAVDVLTFESYDGVNWIGQAKLNVH